MSGNVSSDGNSERTDLWYRVAGRGANLVLVSGLNGKAQFWDRCMGALASDYRVLTFDQRGCGATLDDGADWTVGSLAADAMELADEIFRSEPYAVVGHSTGGAITQCMLARRPDLARAGVLSGTWVRADDYMRALFGLRLSLLQRAPDLDAELGHLLRASPENFAPLDKSVALAPDVTSRRIRALLAHDGARYLQNLEAPVLVVGAEDDRIVPEHLVRQVHEQAPNSDLWMLPEGGHFFPQTCPEEFAEQVTSWLRRNYLPV